MLKINLQNIQYFLKVAETLNFTIAAKELYLSQPALSKQIRQLEEAIGVQLFQRDTKGVALTEGGKIMFHVWSNSVREMELAIQRASIANSMHKKKLRVGVLESDGVINLMIPYVEQFGETQDGLEMEYAIYGFSELKERLKNGDLDIIFSFSTELPRESSGVVFKNLQELELNIIVSKKNHFYERDELQVPELKDETFYIFSNEYTDEMKQSIVQHCRRYGFYPARIKYFPNITSLAVGLTSGDGVTIGYREFFNYRDRLKFFPISDEIGRHHIVAAWHGNRQDIVEPLLDFLDKTM